MPQELRHQYSSNLGLWCVEPKIYTRQAFEELHLIIILFISIKVNVTLCFGHIVYTAKVHNACALRL